MRLNQRHERWLYAICGLLFISGSGWLVAHYLLATDGEFGEPHAASEPWWLRLHGAAAMAAQIIFGSLFPNHIARAWSSRRNYRSGLFMLALVALLIMTGYGLYYAGNEEIRPWISAVHWAVGIVAGGGLILHALLGKRQFRHRLSDTPRSLEPAKSISPSSPDSSSSPGLAPSPE